VPARCEAQPPTSSGATAARERAPPGGAVRADRIMTVDLRSGAAVREAAAESAHAAAHRLHAAGAAVQQHVAQRRVHATSGAAHLVHRSSQLFVARLAAVSKMKLFDPARCAPPPARCLDPACCHHPLPTRPESGHSAECPSPPGSFGGPWRKTGRASCRSPSSPARSPSRPCPRRCTGKSSLPVYATLCQWRNSRRHGPGFPTTNRRCCWTGKPREAGPQCYRGRMPVTVRS
jgi:hypothetical protein